MVYTGQTAVTPGDHYDSQREREFYRYYDPIRALSDSGPRWTDLYDEVATRQHRPKSCPDLSLTAFCQLGALRLGTKRCMLFFFDRSNAYVLAEATRTLSLHDHDVHENGDALWLGFTIIPRGLSVCEHTVNMPVPDEQADEVSGEKNLIHVIEDLRGNTTFCDRPYVSDGPKARFYAGVPIITPSGLRIGAYCVLDDKPREGLNESDTKFMLEMAKTVMTHLETVRERAEFGRGTRMLKGLRSFVQDATVRRTEDPATGTAPSVDDHFEERIPNKFDHSVTFSDPEIDGKSVTITQATPTIPSSIDDDIDEEPTKSQTSPPQADPIQTSPLSSHPSQGPGSAEFKRATGGDVNSVFNNAAELIREAMDAEGCVFLNVADESYESARLGKSLHQRSPSEQSAGATDTGSEYSDANPTQRAAVKGCSLLGQSCRANLLDDSSTVGSLPPSTLRRLLRRHPRGKIWNFNSEGEVLSSDQLTDTHVKQPSGLAINENARRRRRKNKHSPAEDAAELQAIFPEVRSLCLVGMWDLRTQRWRAGFFVWSSSPVRVFSVRGELSYVVAFGEVIMAEVMSLEAKREEKKRSDFVESISHELRSPLHGILGSIDVLNQDRPDLQDSTDLRQIESCTLTMLDLVEHLLGYAEYKRRSKTRQSIEDNKSYAESDSSQQEWPAERPMSMDLSPGISIARATEELCDVLFHSHNCEPVESPREKLDMALDIALVPEYMIKAGAGDWKRLCGNIIGNAIKFTDRGHVSISLRLSKRRKRSLAVLVVSDTGCGMSEGFIADGLFRAFRQEDGLKVGMGLGMTLANKIVRGMGGRIQVQSQPNQGTSFRITVPLEGFVPETETLPEARPLGTVKVCIGDPELPDGFVESPGRTEVARAVKATCDRLGTELVSIKDAQVIVLFDDEFTRMANQESTNHDLKTKPLLVLCRDARDIQQLRETAVALAQPRIEYLPQPYGPKRLTDAIRSCVSRCLQSDPNVAPDPLRTKRKNSCFDPDILNPSLAAMRLSPRTPYFSDFEKENQNTRVGASEELDQPAPRASPERQQRLPIGPRVDTVTDAKAEVAPPVEMSLTTDVPVTTTSEGTLPITSTSLSVLAGTSKALSLLLVDDNPVNLRLLVTYADKKSHPRLTATNGKEAVDVYSTVALGPTATVPKPDVILLDINMPVMDGFEAARNIRAFENTYDVAPVKIIALTGLGSEEARKEAMQSGIDLFLTKPVRLKELAAILETVKPAVSG
ncbi:response regulator receiver domain-containing protein 2 [Elsinoe australis]|uniref:Response regulator receiver domain-containing protein 2 n=1 Tax=Elsinoe australis TaxID=40998 RepID=A0A4U7B436_9PEZI|nr:response regulator receiver domain-containing protein 2 [Elsinoe australis]